MCLTDVHTATATQETGPHLFEFSPSGVTYEYYAMAIGARSQSAKTYLEKHYEEFADADLDTLIMHGLNALRDTLQQDKDLTTLNTSIVSSGSLHGRLAWFLTQCLAYPQSTVGPASISAILSASLLAQNPPKPSISTTEATSASAFQSIKSIVPVSASSSSEAYLSERFTIVEGDDLKQYLDRLEPKEGAAPATGTEGTQGAPSAETAAGSEPTVIGGSMETD